MEYSYSDAEINTPNTDNAEQDSTLGPNLSHGTLLGVPSPIPAIMKKQEAT